MKHAEATTLTPTEALETARQIEIELKILLHIEESLRVALQWMTRDRGNSRKISTIRFAARSFERHLTRTRVLADLGGYLRTVTARRPHFDSQVKALRKTRAALQTEFEHIVLQLEYVSSDDPSAVQQVCSELEHYLDNLKAHGQKEMELVQHSYTQEEGGSG